MNWEDRGIKCYLNMLIFNKLSMEKIVRYIFIVVAIIIALILLGLGWIWIGFQGGIGGMLRNAKPDVNPYGQ